MELILKNLIYSHQVIDLNGRVVHENAKKTTLKLQFRRN